MILKPLTLNNLLVAREWRNELMAAWRTPFMLTEEMQEDFYRNVICDRRSNLRYWAFWDEMTSHPDLGFIGFGGIENIVWENRTGEISLLVDPELRGRGYGSEALRQILIQAFDMLNLLAVRAECYECNDSLGFWKKMGEKYKTCNNRLLYGKYYGGKYWASKFFFFERGVCKPLL